MGFSHKKTLFPKDAHRTFCCMVRYRQGHVGGKAAGMVWELSASSSDCDAGEVTLEAEELCSLAQPKDPAGQAAQHPPVPAWGYSDSAWGHTEI